MKRPKTPTLDWKSLLTDWSSELLETELAHRLAPGHTRRRMGGVVFRQLGARSAALPFLRPSHGPRLSVLSNSRKDQ